MRTRSLCCRRTPLILRRRRSRRDRGHCNGATRHRLTLQCTATGTRKGCTNSQRTCTYQNKRNPQKHQHHHGRDHHCHCHFNNNDKTKKSNVKTEPETQLKKTRESETETETEYQRETKRDTETGCDTHSSYSVTTGSGTVVPWQ